jgi:hypothetical protein
MRRTTGFRIPGPMFNQWLGGEFMASRRITQLTTARASTYFSAFSTLRRNHHWVCWLPSIRPVTVLVTVLLSYAFYAFYEFYAWWIYFPQSGALAEGGLAQSLGCVAPDSGSMTACHRTGCWQRTDFVLHQRRCSKNAKLQDQVQRMKAET